MNRLPKPGGVERDQRKPAETITRAVNDPRMVGVYEEAGLVTDGAEVVSVYRDPDLAAEAMGELADRNNRGWGFFLPNPAPHHKPSYERRGRRAVEDGGAVVEVKFMTPKAKDSFWSKVSELVADTRQPTPHEEASDSLPSPEEPADHAESDNKDKPKVFVGRVAAWLTVVRHNTTGPTAHEVGKLSQGQDPLIG